MIVELNVKYCQLWIETADTVLLGKNMIISIDNGVDVDTDVLSSEERHILQKLLCYKVIVNSLSEFRENTDRAFTKGWNDSGPVRKSETLVKVIQQMEKDLLLRLDGEGGEEKM